MPRWVIPAGALLLVLAIAGYLRWFSERGLDPTQRTELLRSKNKAVAALDAERFAEAAGQFAALAEALPEEVLPARNLAICRHAVARALKDASAAGAGGADPAAVTAASDAARAAAEDLLAREPDSPVAHWLAAQSALLAVDLPEAVDGDPVVESAWESLRRAAELEPDGIVSRYALYELADKVRDAGGELSAERRAQADAAVLQAFANDPRNIALWRAALSTQAAAEDAEIAATLGRIGESIAPVRAQVLTSRGGNRTFDLAGYLERAAAAAVGGRWDEVRREVRSFNALIVGEEAAKQDLKLCRPDPATFAMLEFSEAFDAAGVAEEGEAPALTIRFDGKPAEGIDVGGGAIGALCVVDFDLDRRLDLALLRDSRVEAWSRGAEGESWRLIAAASVPAGMRALFAADLYLADTQAAPDQKRGGEDGEGAGALRHSRYLGLVVYGEAGVQVLRNTMDETPPGEVAELQPQAEELGKLRSVSAVETVDFDHDGDLDLAIASDAGLSLWLNRGVEVAFDDVTAYSDLPTGDTPIGSLIAVDWDRDVDIDVIVGGGADPSSPLGVLENLRHGQLRWRPFAAGQFDGLRGAARLALLEADGNVSWDLLGGGGDGLRLALTRTEGAGDVRYMDGAAFDDAPVEHFVPCDFDNDGFQDVAAWAGDELRFWRGAADRGFAAAGWEAAGLSGAIAAADVGDLDADGDIDLALASGGGVVVLWNEGGDANHWLSVGVVGAADNVSGRVNHFGIGSLIELRNGARYGAQVVRRATTHFGLGGSSEADALRLILTNGIPQSVIRPSANQRILEAMVAKGSCPYVYTWTGERFEFFTDLLWASPIGLQFAPGVLAPCRPWEYIHIPGESLAERDGSYELQVTEELWEAAYFDEIQLIAIDHPAEVHTYSNEKVGPPQVAPHKIHTVRERRHPVAATDSSGRDVLSQIARADGVYLQPFQKQLRKGLTELHHLELDLGDLGAAEQLTLFLTGWINPTDTSLNIAIAQDPTLEAPRPPSVWVPDASGEWREAIPYMGFPGGKTKTIAVDISRIFVGGDYRLRVVTSNEIYWDEVFFSADEEPAETVELPLQLVSADLHFRGCSRRIDRPDNAPKHYDYAQLETAPRWPPMRGKFTRFGDVRELLAASDERLVVMGSGDELTLRFSAPPPPGEGWRRDFVMYNVGWDKDADLNTVWGQTVEPLPYRAMQRYPADSDAAFPDSAEHRDYLNEYQTREQSWAEFWEELSR